MVNLSRIFPRVSRSVWLTLPVFWMVFIFVMSSRQRVQVSDEYLANFLFFKSLHIIEYAVLMLLNVMALIKNEPAIPLRRALRVSFAAAIIYAISDEVHQTFVPTRTGKLQDVLIDSLGIGSVYWLLSRYAYTQKGTPSRLHPRTT